MDFSFFNSDVFRLVALPLLIFAARAADVTLATLRILFLSKGLKYTASLLGFFEILIWLLALGQVMHNLTNVINYIAYAGGFAMGNLIGSIIEGKLAVGKVVVRIITQRDATELLHELNAKQYGVTSVDAKGSSGAVQLIFTVINRKRIKEVTRLVHRYNPRAFISIEDVRATSEGFFLPKRGFFPGSRNLFSLRRAGK